MENFKQTTCLPLLRSSYNGLTKSEQKLADFILKNPAEVMHMTMSELADVVLTGMARETSYRSEAMASQLVHLAILDCLYTGVMLRRMDDYIDNMKQVRKAIATQKL